MQMIKAKLVYASLFALLTKVTNKMLHSKFSHIHF